MKLIPEIPCKDCITFAVCNAQITNNKPFEDVVVHLIPKCSLIREYTKCPSSVYDYYGDYAWGLVLQTARFFKPKKSFPT